MNVIRHPRTEILGRYPDNSLTVFAFQQSPIDFVSVCYQVDGVLHYADLNMWQKSIINDDL
jgi:hypothetical protein